MKKFRQEFIEKNIKNLFFLEKYRDEYEAEGIGGVTYVMECHEYMTILELVEKEISGPKNIMQLRAEVELKIRDFFVWKDTVFYGTR